MIAVGLCLPQLGDHVTRAALRTFCEQAERIGFASLWVQEHFFWPLVQTAPYAARPGLTTPVMYQTTYSPLETLMAAAAWTETITIGTSILVGGYHRPVELAHRLATIDQLSNGRLVAGLSVGWSKDEHDQMDVDFHTRGRRMNELVDAMIACWGPDPVSFDGEFFQIPPSIVRPKPAQTPHPPLLSGMKSAGGLARTAAVFDIWNPASGTVDQIRAMRAELDEMRPPGKAPIDVYQRVFTMPPFAAPGLGPLTLETMADAIRAAQAAGFSHVIVDLSFDETILSPDDWAATPERLAPLLKAARP
jgi:probable F420-dependent oxidoreductase